MNRFQNSLVMGVAVLALSSCAGTRIARLDSDAFIEKLAHDNNANSFAWVTPIGVTKDRAYLDYASMALLGSGVRHRVYWTEIAGLPQELVKGIDEGTELKVDPQVEFEIRMIFLPIVETTVVSLKDGELSVKRDDREIIRKRLTLADSVRVRRFSTSKDLSAWNGDYSVPGAYDGTLINFEAKIDDKAIEFSSSNCEPSGFDDFVTIVNGIAGEKVLYSGGERDGSEVVHTQ